MPRNVPSREPLVCDHAGLEFATSSYADTIGYIRPTSDQRAKAAGKTEAAEDETETLFPGPLVLPGDDLSFDPDSDPQSLRSWTSEKARNAVTRRRNVLYIVGSPEVAAEVSFVHGWSLPHKANGEDSTARPPLLDVADYLGAFYHGMEVKVLPRDTLRFTEWDENKKRGRDQDKPRLIGLNTATERIGICWRPSLDGVFSGQLNLDDLLDTAIGMLPDDAYALLMLVEHDLFEDEDDDFCCGRAYGGSRVAVVSMARYNPCLDARQNVERQHAWPASHCGAYVRVCCEGASQHSRKRAKKAVKQSGPSSSGIDVGAKSTSPLSSALAAHKRLFSTEPTSMQERLAGHWLSRVCQTASHELGHCFGVGHCVYYACVMQGTSSLAEDVRQPPYLCPVDLAKVLKAISADRAKRYEALKVFCEKHENVPTFAAFGAWLESRLSRLYGLTRRTSETGSKDAPIEL